MNMITTWIPTIGVNIVYESMFFMHAFEDERDLIPGEQSWTTRAFPSLCHFFSEKNFEVKPPMINKSREEIPLSFVEGLAEGNAMTGNAMRATFLSSSNLIPDAINSRERCSIFYLQFQVYHQHRSKKKKRKRATHSPFNFAVERSSKFCL